MKSRSTGWTCTAAVLVALLPTSAMPEQPKPSDEALIKARRAFLVFTMDEVGAPTLDLFTPDFEVFVRQAAREAAFGRLEPRRDQLLTHWAYSVRLRYSCEPTTDAAAARTLAKRVAERPPRALLTALGTRSFAAYMYNKPYWELKWARAPRGGASGPAALSTVGKDYDNAKTVLRGTVRMRRTGGRWRVVFADYRGIMNADWPTYRRYLVRVLTARQTAPKRFLSGQFDRFLVGKMVIGHFTGLSGFLDNPAKASCAYYRKDAPNAGATLRERVQFLEARALKRVLEPISQWHLLP